MKKGRAYGKGRAATPLTDPCSLAELLDERPVRLSVCLITRDEEELLPACLDSAAPVADEIIVVDTGSRDATPQLARSRGAQVVHHEWNDDFSAARNEALRHARGDWILFLDADERLVAESQAGLRAGIERGRFDYATVAIESLVGGETLITRAIRLYRNYPGLRFLGRVHEQIAPALHDLEARFPLRRAEADIRLIHLGYDPALFAARGKEERNARLVDVELSERGDNAYVRLKAGEALFARGKFEAALEPIADGLAATWRAIDAGEADALILEEPVTLHAACLVALSRPEEALATLAKTHGRLAPTANTLYLEGVGLWALGRAGAKEKLVAAMRAPDGRGELFTLPEVRGATPPFLLGSLALAEGDAAQARAWFEVALAREPGHREARLGLAEALFHAGSPAGAVQTLSGALASDPSDLRSWQAGAVYLVASPGQEASARAWLDAACALFPQDGVLDRLATDLRARG